MKPKKRYLAFGTALILFGYALWPISVRPAILYAYSDNAFSMWGLTLYKDGKFIITLPAADESGCFRVTADTIELQYDEPAKGLPVAYVINRERKKIDVLHRMKGKWIVINNSDWMELQYDSTRFYAH